MFSFDKLSKAIVLAMTKARRAVRDTWGLLEATGIVHKVHDAAR
jgi:hypothetical protein